MKAKKQPLMSRLLLFLFFLLFSISGFSQQTSTVFSGNWSDNSRWSSGMPNNNDDIYVHHNMVLNRNIQVGWNKELTIYETGSIIDPNGGQNYNLTANGSNIEVRGPLVLGGMLNLGTSTTFLVDTNVIINGNFVANHACNIIVRSYDTLIVGNTSIGSSNVRFNIEEFGVMIINGDLDIGHNANIHIDGNVFVNGDISTGWTAEVTGSGSLETTGEADLGGNVTFFGNSTTCSPGPCQYGSGGGLPITLLSFEAKHSYNGKVKLEWITESEINNDYFLVEKSLDGFIFEEIAKINGAGNSLKQETYHIFTEAESVVSYYRLTQVDYNGASKSFNPIAIGPASSTLSGDWQVYPNPLTNGNRFNVVINSPEENSFSCEIRDINGKLLLVEEMQGGTNQFSIDQLPNGVYFLYLKGNHDIQAKKLIVRQ